MNEDSRELARPESVTLGTAGLTITRLGLGAGRLHTRDAAVQITRKQATDTIHAALTAGIRYIDTAPMYGQGESEAILGDALAQHPAGQTSTVTTKVGNYPDDFSYTARAAIDSVRGCLARLRRGRVDLVQAHELKPHTVERVLAPGGAVDGLDELRGQQVVGHIGFTTSDVDCAVQALESGRFETAMLWRRADILDDRLITAAGPVAQCAGVAVIVAAPFAAGLLTRAGEAPGRRRRQPPPQTLARLRSLRDLCRDHGVGVEPVALHFALRQPGVAAVVAGAQHAGHIHQQLAWLNAVPPESLWRDVARLRVDWADNPATELPAVTA